jgi:hypothetical protein
VDVVEKHLLWKALQGWKAKEGTGGEYSCYPFAVVDGASLPSFFAFSNS